MNEVLVRHVITARLRSELDQKEQQGQRADRDGPGKVKMGKPVRKT